MARAKANAKTGTSAKTIEGLTPDRLLELYRLMKLTRTSEDRLVKLYKQGKVMGGVYTGPGNEGCSVGTAFALEDGDWILPLHRDVGAAYARGMPAREMFCQSLGRGNGPTGGRDNGVHQTVLERGQIGMVSHLGTMIPIAAGVALVSQMNGDGRVAMNWTGDGATSLGDFHEALNFAGVQKLPLILVIDNNQVAYSTPQEKQYACAKLSDRAAGYGIRGETVDGTDVLAVYRAAKAAVDRARSGEGATLLECVTMRMRGHSEADDYAYVPKAKLEAWRKKDPIERLEARLRAEGILDDARKADLEQAVNAEIDDAAAYAEASPMPDPQTAEGPVYA